MSGRQEARQHPNGGRLTRSIRSEEAYYLALIDRERDVVDRHLSREQFREVFDLDRGRHGHLLRQRLSPYTLGFRPCKGSRLVQVSG